MVRPFLCLDGTSNCFAGNQKIDILRLILYSSTKIISWLKKKSWNLNFPLSFYHCSLLSWSVCLAFTTCSKHWIYQKVLKLLKSLVKSLGALIKLIKFSGKSVMYSFFLQFSCKRLRKYASNSTSFLGNNIGYRRNIYDEITYKKHRHYTLCVMYGYTISILRYIMSWNLQDKKRFISFSFYASFSAQQKREVTASWNS